MAMTAPDLGYDTDILFMIPSPYYLPDLGIKWLNQNILASREVFHALCAYKFLLGVKRRFFRCVEESVKVEEDKANTQDGTEGMNGLWHRVHYGMEDDKCELGARGLESVIALIIAGSYPKKETPSFMRVRVGWEGLYDCVEARRYQIDLNLSTFSEPMTFQRAIAVLRVHFEEVLRPTKVGRYSRLFPGYVAYYFCC